MTFSERIYRVMLKAYPAEYRDRFGQAMAQAFGDHLQAATSASRFLRFWLRMAADWVKTVPARHWEHRTARKLTWRSWSEEGRRAIFFARYEAIGSGHSEVTAEDLLLGVLRIERAFAENVFGDTAIGDLRGLRRGSGSGSHWKGFRIAHPAPLSDPCKRALSRAAEEAKGAGASRIGAQHLIGGILQEEGSLAARVLLRHGVDLAQVRSRYL